jgi:hypothetical protein
MADFATLSLTTAYSSLLSQISGRDDDLAMGLDPAYCSPTNAKTHFMRFNSVNKRWENYNGTSWVNNLPSGGYAIDISGNAATASAVAWSGITGKPTTVGGYGITDIGSYAPTLGGTGATGTWGISISGNAATASAVTWSGVSGKPTTVGGYGITDIGSYAPSLGGTGATGTWGISISGNAATASTSSACSGNAATATTASSCSGNSATATSATNGVTVATSSLASLPAANTVSSFTHGLGGVPDVYRVLLVCITTDQGYAVGDEIDVTGLTDGDGARMTTTWANATTVGYITSVASSALFIRSRSTNGSAAITPANWNLKFKAIKQ